MEEFHLLTTLRDRGTHTPYYDDLFKLLLSCDETDRIEAKEISDSLGTSFLETVSTFSNEPDLGGGYILLGVAKNSDMSGPRCIVKGIKDPDVIQQQIANQCRQCFNVPIRPLITVIPLPEGTVILVHITEIEGHNKPVYITSQGQQRERIAGLVQLIKHVRGKILIRSINYAPEKNMMQALLKTQQ